MSNDIFRPDISQRPLSLTVERKMQARPSVLYHAWTDGFDSWFAAPGTLMSQARVNTPFYFETHFQDQRHPHYGRFLRLELDKLVELTWVTGAGGTKGAETILTVELEPAGEGTLLRLTHAGFLDEESRDQHKLAWETAVLEHLDNQTR